VAWSEAKELSVLGMTGRAKKGSVRLKSRGLNRSILEELAGAVDRCSAISWLRQWSSTWSLH